MPGLLPDIDPEGLLEYSVVFTDRALNHMSVSFQGVMRDISRTLKDAYRAQGGRRRPRQRHVRHGVRRAPVRDGEEVPGDPQRLVQLPLDADLRHGPHPCRGDRAQGTAHGRRQAGAVDAAAGRGSRRGHRGEASRRRVRAARRDVVRHPPARRLPARRGGRRPCSRRAVRPRLHRIGRDVGRHGGDRRRRADQRAAKGLERFAVLRVRDAFRARAHRDRRHGQHELRVRSPQVAVDHGGVREGRPRVPRDDADRRA